MKPPYRIALVLETSLGYDRGVVQGVRGFVASGHPWRVRMISLGEGFDIALRRVRDLAPFGIIVRASNQQHIDAITALCPNVVNIAGTREDLSGPRVGVDNEAAGALAGEHLLDQGFTSFACLLHATSANAERRAKGFCHALAAHASEVPVFHGESVANVSRWLMGLPRPTGLYISADPYAVHVLEICDELGLRVPDDLGIISTDNDPFLCEFALPTLSSVDISTRTVGFRAAECLSQLLEGYPAPSQPVLVPPGQVVVRQSTELLAVSDPDVASALRFIRTNSSRPIDVQDVLSHVPCSRRKLERNFRRALRRTIHDEIRHVRLNKARILLADTDLDMAEIAHRCGFSNQTRLAFVFHQQLGMTPRDYRSAMRHKPLVP